MTRSPYTLFCSMLEIILSLFSSSLEVSISNTPILWLHRVHFGKIQAQNVNWLWTWNRLQSQETPPSLSPPQWRPRPLRSAPWRTCDRRCPRTWYPAHQRLGKHICLRTLGKSVVIPFTTVRNNSPTVVRNILSFNWKLFRSAFVRGERLAETQCFVDWLEPSNVQSRRMALSHTHSITWSLSKQKDPGVINISLIFRSVSEEFWLHGIQTQFGV